ncbi:hypothetical protein DFH94DRAFT_700065 [Russula ochroleuca]|uniref:Uncharacterized protein n=1 Tax=Russula ochroleuca TaxID=152965 RepID=A0A9P5JSZ4_9AGAM|nr:hypothetical protein DFH94DRAFT_700065 [Russula ochroleuca]
MNLDIMDSRAVGPLSLSPHTTVETTTILRGLWLTMTILFARIALRPMWLMWGPDVAHYYVMCYVSDMHGDAKHCLVRRGDIVFQGFVFILHCIFSIVRDVLLGGLIILDGLNILQIVVQAECALSLVGKSQGAIVLFLVVLLLFFVSAQPTRALGLGEPSPLVSTSAMISASLKIENHRSSAIAAFTWARVAIDTAQDIHAQGPKGTMPTVVVFVVRPGLVAFGAVGPLVETRGLGIIGGAG